VKGLGLQPFIAWVTMGRRASIWPTYPDLPRRAGGIRQKVLPGTAAWVKKLRAHDRDHLPQGRVRRAMKATGASSWACERLSIALLVRLRHVARQTSMRKVVRGPIQGALTSSLWVSRPGRPRIVLGRAPQCGAPRREGHPNRQRGQGRTPRGSRPPAGPVGAPRESAPLQTPYENELCLFRSGATTSGRWNHLERGQA